jgi:hypothetical protein
MKRRSQTNTTSTLHPLYNNLFRGPSAEQMERMKRNEAREHEYMDTIYAFRAEHGHDMPLPECEALYSALKVKYA